MRWWMWYRPPWRYRQSRTRFGFVPHNDELPPAPDLDGFLAECENLANYYVPSGS